MWVSKKKYESLLSEIQRCRNQVIEMSRHTDNKIYAMAKKILRQPEELSKEIQERDDLNTLIENFIKH